MLLQPTFHASDYAGVQRLLMAGAGIGAIPDIDAAEKVVLNVLVLLVALLWLLTGFRFPSRKPGKDRARQSDGEDE